jgi:hypothetical protein
MAQNLSVKSRKVNCQEPLKKFQQAKTIALRFHTHPYQPIKTGFTWLKPLSPGKNRFSPGQSYDIEGDGGTKGVMTGDNEVIPIGP